MERAKVLLRKTEGGAYVEIGRITARRGRSLTVQTGEGDLTEHERRPGDITPDVGSYFHVPRLAPTAVERLLDEDPARVFKQLINDFPGLTSKGLKDKLDPSMDALGDRAWNCMRRHDAPRLSPATASADVGAVE